MKRQHSIPSYEVEFLPLERRLREDRRKYAACSYSGPERRQSQSRRDGEVAPARLRRQT